MEKEINLEKILKQDKSRWTCLEDNGLTETVTDAMREAVRQALAIASENAVSYIFDENNEIKCEVRKSSILSVIELIK